MQWGECNGVDAMGWMQWGGNMERELMRACITYTTFLWGCQIMVAIGMVRSVGGETLRFAISVGDAGFGGDNMLSQHVLKSLASRVLRIVNFEIEMPNPGTFLV
jgi:hypothetical protein